MARMKDLQQQARYYENRWKTSKDGNNVGQMYAATEDYENNIKEQEKELQKMDPNSREYEKAERSIDEQKSKLWDMNYIQKRAFSDDKMRESLRELEAKNESISKEMSSAEKRGDVKTYEQLRTQYEKNINAQDRISSSLRENGVECRDTVQRQKVDLYNHDVNMRDKLGEKIAEQQDKGKKIDEKDRESAEKYIRQVKKDEIENVKWQGERTVRNMENRGASQEEIKNQKEQNEETVKYVERINR